MRWGEVTEVNEGRLGNWGNVPNTVKFLVIFLHMTHVSCSVNQCKLPSLCRVGRRRKLIHHALHKASRLCRTALLCAMTSAAPQDRDHQHQRVQSKPTKEKNSTWFTHPDCINWFHHAVCEEKLFYAQWRQQSQIIETFVGGASAFSSSDGNQW